MTDIQEQKIFHQIKKIKKNPENNILKLQKRDMISKHIIIQRKKGNNLIPNSVQNERTNISFAKGHNKNITINVSNKRNIISNNNNYQNLINDNNYNEEKILLERPKIRIKMNSFKHNNTRKNTISSEKNNQPIKCKVHKAKPLTTTHSNEKFIKFSESIIKKGIDKQNKRNYGTININKNNLFSKEKKNVIENEDKSYINYYNMIQEKSINNLSNHLDNLIRKKILSQSQHSVYYRNNNEINSYSFLEKVKSEKGLTKNEKIKNKNICNTNVYRKKIQRKKNCFTNTNTFSDTNYLTLDKSDIYNIIKNKIPKNRKKRNFSINRNNNNYEEQNTALTNLNNNRNNSILITNSFKKEYINNKNNIKIKTNFTNMDNIKKKNLIFNNNENKKYKKNKINYIEIIKPDDTDNRHFSSKKFNYTNFRYKDYFHFDTPKNNLIINTTNLTNLDELTTHSKNENSLNLIHGNDDNIVNINKKCITLYSRNTSQYNTVNTLHNSEKNIFIYKNPSLNNNRLNRIIILNNNNDVNKKNSNSKKIFLRNILPKYKKMKNNTTNNSCNTKLRNLITSIEYSNKSNKKSEIKNYNEINDKNIILSEYDQNGKVNIKVREMKKSIEKILRDNSLNKRKKNIYIPPPQKMNLLMYVKKNQGTHIQKRKLHNNIVSRIKYYPPPIPFQC